MLHLLSAALIISPRSRITTVTKTEDIILRIPEDPAVTLGVPEDTCLPESKSDKASAQQPASHTNGGRAPCPAVIRACALSTVLIAHPLWPDCIASIDEYWLYYSAGPRSPVSTITPRLVLQASIQFCKLSDILQQILFLLKEN